MEKLSLERAVEKWVGEFNCINQSLIQRIMCSENNMFDFTEVTVPVVGDYVGTNDCDYNDVYEVVEVDYENNKVTIRDNDDNDVVLDYEDIYLEHDEILPMWGWMWTFGDGSDEAWARENLKEVSECGFRIFEDETDGTLYIGIDGCGYNFYNAHWIPLYKARGLKWHVENFDEIA